MNLFTYLYSQIYLLFKNFLGTKKPHLHAIMALTGLVYVNVFSLFPSLRKPIEDKTASLYVVGVLVFLIVAIAIPLITYLLVNFDHVKVDGERKDAK